MSSTFDSESRGSARAEAGAGLRTIGILGGMGPEATASLYLRIVRIFQQRFGARLDEDFPPMLISSLPVPDVVERVADESRLVERLREGARALESAGADFLLMACNTVQQYLPLVREATALPWIDLMEEIGRTVVDRGHRTVGVLGTEATVRERLIERACAQVGRQVLTPSAEEQTAITGAILDILAGQREAPRAALRPVLTTLHRRGAEAVILGCTDLPLVLSSDDAPLPLIDTLEILAEAAVREARG
jgi:aspartate racemase